MLMLNCIFAVFTKIKIITNQTLISYSSNRANSTIIALYILMNNLIRDHIVF